MQERNGVPAPQHSPAPPDTDHRDDHGKTPLPRPGRVTTTALTQARSVLAAAERQIIRARGNQRWRLIMRIDSARATLRAAEYGVAA